VLEVGVHLIVKPFSGCEPSSSVREIPDDDS